MAANDSAIACGVYQTFFDMLALAIGKDASGKPYLRQYETTNVAGSKWFTCGATADSTNIEATMAALFAKDANGDVSLRTAKA